MSTPPASTALAPNAVAQAASHLARRAARSMLAPVALAASIVAVVAAAAVTGRLDRLNLGALVLVGVVFPGPAALYFFTKRRRHERIAAAAATRPELAWRLAGVVVEATRDGARVPELTFLVDVPTLGMLGAPAARVISRR